VAQGNQKHWQSACLKIYAACGSSAGGFSCAEFGDLAGNCLPHGRFLYAID
jgi:hypothetical protein